MRDHGLRTLAVASHKGVIFGTLDSAAPPLEDYLDVPLVDAIDRLFSRPIKVLGHMRQRIRGNWKLYAENTRDPYHAALLHMFHATFGTYRSNQKSVGYIDRTGAHATGAKHGDEFGQASSASDAVGQDKVLNYSLADPSLMRGRPDFNDGVTVSITSIFPSLVVQQIMNTLATRHIRPKAPNEFELYWTYFGYADEMLRARIKQANLVGPAGLISMEDGEAIELIQRAIQRGDDSAFLEFGGRGLLTERGNGEGAIRGFWMNYAKRMGFVASDGTAAG